MINLIPTEHWEYGLGDLLHGIAAIVRKDNTQEISLPGLGGCWTTGSGRAGLVIALRALDLDNGARIGVPLYCCPVVLKAIEVANCTPVFIDVDPETFCISVKNLESRINGLDALVALHMFGNMCDMRALKTITKDKPIIEDCAQALGSKLDGRPAGSFGDISFFSFRSGKYLSAGEGGAVFSPDEIRRKRLREAIVSLLNTSNNDETLHTIKTYIRSKLRSKPLYGLVGHQLWAFYNKTTEHNAKATVQINHIYMSDLSIARKRLKTIDNAVDSQRNNAMHYSKYLMLEQNMTCKEMPGTFYNRYIYPLLLPTSRQRDLIADYMYKQGIGTIKPYHDIPFIAQKYHGYKGDCPLAENIAKRVLAIPNHHHLKEKERQHIVNSVNKSWTMFHNK